MYVTRELAAMIAMRGYPRIRIRKADFVVIVALGMICEVIIMYLLLHLSGINLLTATVGVLMYTSLDQGGSFARSF